MAGHQHVAGSTVLIVTQLYPPPVLRLPVGFAGILAGCFGVAGAVVGMSEVWYTGPLGKDAGAEFGADLGFEVSIRFLTETISTSADMIPLRSP